VVLEKPSGTPPCPHILPFMFGLTETGHQDFEIFSDRRQGLSLRWQAVEQERTNRSLEF
jgi:hypothetical protein